MKKPIDLLNEREEEKSKLIEHENEQNDREGSFLEPPKRPVQLKSAEEEKENDSKEGYDAEISSSLSFESASPPPVQRKQKNTGLPNNLKDGVENLSGYSMDDVNVHYNSEKPAQLQAAAYTQGSDIHIGPGEEEHLSHEAWHVVQQKQGRVQPTSELNGAHQLNDNNALENEADVFGSKAEKMKDYPDKGKDQRTEGQTSTGSQPIIQRFVKSSKYTKTNTDDTLDHMFKSQSEDPQVTKDNKIRHTESHAKHPSLYFSDDGTIAINSSKGESKEFYATPKVVSDANEALLGKGSAVKLTANSKAKVDMNGKSLFRITPTIRTSLDGDYTAGDDATFGTHICIEVAQMVIGNLSRSYTSTAVFKNPDEDATHEETFKPDGTGASEVYKLADQLGAGGDISKENMHERISGGDKKPHADEEYGKSSKMKGKHNTSKIDHLEKSLGVNKYAIPDIGEAFATFSTRPATSTKGHAWGYHYAGIVAKSEDGRDSITLENYNRKTDNKEMMKKLWAKLMRQNRKIITNKVKLLTEQLKGLEQKNPEFGQKSAERMDLSAKEFSTHALKEVIIAINETKGKTREEGLAIYNDAIKAESEKKWYFHMYGMKKGQTFHEQNVKSGYYKDPLTLRIKNAE